MVKFLRRRYEDAGQAKAALVDLESNVASAVDQLDKAKRHGWNNRAYYSGEMILAPGDAVTFGANGTVQIVPASPKNAGSEVLVATGVGVTSAVIVPTTGTINGSASYTMTTASRSRIFYSTGVEWVTNA